MSKGRGKKGPRQGDLFVDAPPHPPFNVAYATSREAAIMMEPIAGAQRKAVLEVLRAKPEGVTDFEIEAALPRYAPSGLRGRRSELVEAGLVKSSGDVRETQHGRHAVVWVAVETEFWKHPGKGEENADADPNGGPPA